MDNNKAGNKIWLGFIGGGMLATILGFCALDLAPGGAAAPVFGVMLLLTGGMLSCLAGAVGMAGMLAWLPGMNEAEHANVQGSANK